jgi:hypothetical protein
MLVVAVASWAAAIDLPPDAELIVTSEDSTIVGFGRTVGGASFELTVLPGYSGPATLTLLHPDGATSRLDVVLDAGRVTIDGVDLDEALRDYEEVRVLVADDGAPASPSPGRRPGAGRAGPPRSADDPPDRPDVGPVEAPEPSREAEPEADPEGPADDRPGRSGETPADDERIPNRGPPPDAGPDAEPERAADPEPEREREPDPEPDPDPGPDPERDRGPDGGPEDRRPDEPGRP